MPLECQNSIRSWFALSIFDRFVLGVRENSEIFYNDGNSWSSGSNDYALIQNFAVGQDILQLKGSLSNYSLSVRTGTGIGTLAADTYIYARTGILNELVAIVQDVNGLTSSSFAQRV